MGKECDDGVSNSETGVNICEIKKSLLKNIKNVEEVATYRAYATWLSNLICIHISLILEGCFR